MSSEAKTSAMANNEDLKEKLTELRETLAKIGEEAGENKSRMK